MTATLWFNPRCGTARTVKAWLDEHGVDYRERRYLDDPPSRAEIEDVLASGDLKAGDLLRAKEAKAKELGLDAASDPDAILDAMVEHPILIDRPVIVDGKRAALCRPADRIEAFYTA